MKLIQLFVTLVLAVPEPEKTIDCDRGGDQASPNERKFLVTDDYPGKYFGPKPLKCVWTVQTSAGSKIQIKVEEIVPCEGGNHLIIKEPSTGATSKKICGKAPKQLITSVGEEITFVLMVPKPGNRGVRAKIGFIQTGEPDGLTIAEFNKGSKAPPPKRAPKKKAPKKKAPKNPMSKSGKLNQMNKKIDQMAKKSTGNVKTRVVHGKVNRWEKQDRRPVIIGAGVVFLLLILGGAFFIGRAMKKDQAAQAELAASGQLEQPKFTIKDSEPQMTRVESTAAEDAELVKAD